MHQLTYALKQLADTYREGRYATQHNRRHMLMQMGEQLVAAGYKHLHVGELKGRHVTTLLAQWTAQALSPGTIRNRLAVVRWWAAKVQKVAILPKDNASYGLPRRQTVARTSKARDLPPDKLTQVRDRYVRMSLQLQRAFGLRREESIGIRAGDCLLELAEECTSCASRTAVSPVLSVLDNCYLSNTVLCLWYGTSRVCTQRWRGLLPQVPPRVLPKIP